MGTRGTPDPNDPYMGAAAVGRMLGKHSSTAKWYQETGRLPAVRVGGRLVSHADDVRKLKDEIEQRENRTALAGANP